LPLVVQNNYQFEGSLLLTFISFLVPQPFTGFIFGDKQNYTTHISKLHDLNIGLGSSVLTEGFAYGVNFLFFYPIFIVFFIYIINKYIYKFKIDGVIIFLFLFSNFFAIFRGSGVTNFATSLMIFFILYILPKELLRHFGLFKN
jgi:hypothetical protein